MGLPNPHYQAMYLHHVISSVQSLQPARQHCAVVAIYSFIVSVCGYFQLLLRSMYDYMRKLNVNQAFRNVCT